MARELYRPVTTVDIPAKTVSTIGGKRIDNRFSPLKRGHIPNLATIVTDLSHNPDGTKLRHISPAHGRSFELLTGRDNTTILFADKFGNIFTSITIKGNALRSPGVGISESQPSGYYFSGLQDGTAIGRITKASQILRANGVDTEIILKIMEPKKLPSFADVTDNMESIKDFKELMPGFYDLSKTDQAQVLITPLIITVRGMSCPERLEDMKQAHYLNCHRKISAVFKRINLVEKTRGSQTPQLDPDKENDIDFYLEEYLPQRIGANLGLMHSAGLTHHYLTTHNINAMGGIVDLDSVTGKPLGDKKTTTADFKDDLSRVCESLCRSDTTDRNKAIINFITCYIKSRGLDTNTNEGSIEIENLLSIPHLAVYYLQTKIMEGLQKAGQNP